MDSPVGIGGIVAFGLAPGRSISEYFFPLVRGVLLDVKVVLIVVRSLEILPPVDMGIPYSSHSQISTTYLQLIRTEWVNKLYVVGRNLIQFLPLKVVSERLHLVCFQVVLLDNVLVLFF